jgi:hypothetical protein
MPVSVRPEIALGAKSFPFAFLTKTSAYTMTVDDGVLLVSGTTTITLPAINADLRESYRCDADPHVSVRLGNPAARCRERRVVRASKGMTWESK